MFSSDRSLSFQLSRDFPKCIKKIYFLLYFEIRYCERKRDVTFSLLKFKTGDFFFQSRLTIWMSINTDFLFCRFVQNHYVRILCFILLLIKCIKYNSHNSNLLVVAI